MKPQDFTKRYPGQVVRTTGGIYTFVPCDLPTKVSFLPEIRDECEDAMLALGRLSAIIPTLPNPDLLTEPFMRREAVLSSKIEGTKTDVGQLYLFETGEKQRIKSTLEDDDVGDAREVLNYVVALRHGLDSLKRMPICNRLLRRLAPHTNGRRSR